MVQHANCLFVNDFVKKYQKQIQCLLNNNYDKTVINYNEFYFVARYQRKNRNAKNENRMIDNRLA